MSIITEWPVRTAQVRPRSLNLQDLDKQVKALADALERGTAYRDMANGLQRTILGHEWTVPTADELTSIVATDPFLKAMEEIKKMRPFIVELNKEIINLLARPPQLSGIKARGVIPMGWTLAKYKEKEDPDEYSLEWQQPSYADEGLTASEIANLNAAVRELKLAITHAREGVLAIRGRYLANKAQYDAYMEQFAKKSREQTHRITLDSEYPEDPEKKIAKPLGPPMDADGKIPLEFLIGTIDDHRPRTKSTEVEGPHSFARKSKQKPLSLPFEERLYIIFFGIIEPERLDRVLQNFRALKIAVGGQMKLRDVQAHKTGAGAMCKTKNRIVMDKGNVMTVRGSPTVLIGKHFLHSHELGYTTRAWVHELAHGVFHAVDVASVDEPSGNFTCGRMSDDPNDRWFGRTLHPLRYQASGLQECMLLARHKPEYAYVNADTYAQFATRLLEAKRAATG